MTTIRGTVKDGRFVFPAEVTEQLGLHGGEAVELPQAVLAAARTREGERDNPFLTWIGALPSLPDGQDAVSFTRELRGGDEDDG